MSSIRRLAKLLRRPITILVVPHADIPMLRARFTLAFLLFGLCIWTGFTLWAGYSAGQKTDYWVTKADNRILRERMAFFAGEIGSARKELDQARETDQSMRELLGMRSRKAILDADGVGGPSDMERIDIARLASAPDQVSREEITRELALLRHESERRIASFQEINWYIGSQRELYRATPSILPAEGSVTSPFGYRFSPFGGGGDENFGEFHPGVDIANSRAMPILAAADGIVLHSGWGGGYGEMVLVDHGHGFTTLYGHTSKIAVHPGERVRRGEVIAYMGTTGRSTGIHLHYEIRRDGRPVNPMSYLRSPRAAQADAGGDE